MMPKFKQLLRMIREALGKIPPPTAKPEFVVAYMVRGKPQLRGLTTIYARDFVSGRRAICDLTRRQPCIYFFLMPANAQIVREDEPFHQSMGN